MKRKRKAVSQAEQSRRFIEAAKDAGLVPDALERIVRQIAKPSPQACKGPTDEVSDPTCSGLAP